MNKKIILAVCLAVLSVFTLKYACADSAELKKSGIVLDMKEGKLTVVGLFPDSPASKAGILTGDVITELYIRNSFVKVDSGSLLHYASLIMNSGSSKRLKVDRKGRTLDINLPDGKIPLNAKNTPRTGINDGKIISVHNNTAKTTLSEGSGAIEGDGFLVINGGQVLGTAKIKKVSSTSELNMDSTLKLNLDKLPGARLVFYEPSSTRFIGSPKLKPADPGEVKARTANPEYYNFKRTAYKNGFTLIPYAKVEKHNPNTGEIEISTGASGSTIPGGTIVFDKNAPRNHMKLSIDRNALFFTSTSMDGGRIHKLPQLKKDSLIEIFYKTEGKTKRVYLILFDPKTQ